MDDLISRADAIKATWQEPTYTDPLNVLTEVRDRIEVLPSAQPKRGEWIRGAWYSEESGFANPIVCSECDSVAPINLGEYELTNYCPNCGARMQTERSESEQNDCQWR